MQTLRGRLVARMPAAQARGMQPLPDWLAVPALEPGSRDAKSAAQPGSPGTRFVSVSHGPGSLHALACMLPAPAREELCRTRCKPNNFFLRPGSMDIATKQKPLHLYM
jgi:hypothetical protein